VGISSMFTEFRRETNRVASIARRALPEATIAMGGCHVSSMPDLILRESPEADFLFIGEAEESFRDFIMRLNSGGALDTLDGFAWRENGAVRINPKRRFIADLDSVRRPAWNLFEMDPYVTRWRRYFWRPRQTPYAQLFTSRGCPARCVFCTSRRLMGDHYRTMSAGRVLADMEHLVHAYGIREFMFYDDNFTHDRDRTRAICNGIMERNWGVTWFPTALALYSVDPELITLMKQSGCYRLTLAIESGSDRVLKEVIHKPITTKQSRDMVRLSRQLGMETIGLFVIGLPGETRDEIRRTVDFAEELDLDFFILSIATPYPGTPLYDLCIEKGYLAPGFDLDQLGTGRACIETPEFTRHELEVIRRKDWLRILFEPPGRKQRLSSMTGLTPEEVDIWESEVRGDLARVNEKYARLGKDAAR
jgi:radical SAM superfamily enzyme YgiQ (UPF0313 family)